MKKLKPLVALTIGQLKETNELYQANYQEWDFLLSVYEGIRSIIAKGYIDRHEREPNISYQRRIRELCGFGYSKSIIEVFHFYLFKKAPNRILGKLGDNPLWKMFIRDADLYNNDYDAVLMDLSLYASILGSMGILVDKSPFAFKTMQQQIDAKVYPYIAKYYPKAILDWKYEKNEYGRPYLSYLKLLDDNGQYRIWTPIQWEVWEIPEQEEKTFGDEIEANLIAIGENKLGEVPFIWHYNIKSKKQGIGDSDIHEVSRLDLSIIRNISQIDEIVYFAAFPMMRKPMRDAKPTDMNSPQQEDEVGVQSVLEFDPEHPESKPDWLASEVADPVDATLKVIEKKISEIYRAANVGGMAATEPTKNAQSGVAKTVDFQLLNSKIISKSINIEDAENRIIEFWLKWENLWDQYKEVVSISRSKTFDIENLSLDLANALTAKTIVQSKKFNALLQKQTARSMLSSTNEDDMNIIDEEIDESTENMDNDNLNNNKTENEKLSDEEKKKIMDDMKIDDILTEE